MNAAVMTQAAAMFGWACAFRDRNDLALDWARHELAPEPTWVSLESLREACGSMVAFDNGEGASVLYGFRPRRGKQMALVVGNERRGIPPDTLRTADHLVQVPMASKRVNCLNVAAASAVALYYLSRGGGGQMFTRKNPHRNRPELLLLGAGDHIELGSTIRSAAAFGWNRAFVEDRSGVWFGVERVARSEGRAAARRGKNSIRLIPTKSDRTFAFEEACVVTTGERGRGLSKVNLARGPSQLVVLADEQSVELEELELGRLARNVRYVNLELPGSDFQYHYRLTSTIALAEVARQVGVRAPKTRRGARPPLYDMALRTLQESGEVVELDELTGY